MTTASLPVMAFAEAAKRLGTCCRAMGMQAPAFRSPPSVPGVTRTIRRYEFGAVVSVKMRDRTMPEVFDDMVAGVLEVNRRPDDVELRQALVKALIPCLPKESAE